MIMPPVEDRRPVLAGHHDFSEAAPRLEEGFADHMTWTLNTVGSVFCIHRDIAKSPRRTYGVEYGG